MRLTTILCRFKKPLPGGHLWRGKYRLYKEVTPQHINELRLQFELEEQNMFYLRHPYLTPEQSAGHTKALGKKETFIKEKVASKEWKDHKYLGDRFGFMKVSESWE